VSHLRLRDGETCHGGELYGGRVLSLAGKQLYDMVVVQAVVCDVSLQFN
jgi:hypothetical protein